MSLDVFYTAEATASGGGRDGHVKSSDDRIDLDTRPPKAAGGSGEGTNPEQLFAAGYAACFLSALLMVARTDSVKLDSATGVTAQVGLGRDGDSGYGINAHLTGYLPGLSQREAEDLMAKAHQVCPYSKATRGNIDVTISAKV